MINKNEVQIKLKLNKTTDADIIAILQYVNKQGYIKHLIRNDLRENHFDYKLFIR